jgi:REP element-mobilizing transposase RayT
MTKPRTKHQQQELAFRPWGGARRGAGRKPKAERAGVSHATRERVDARSPAHVTLKLCDGLANLRRRAECNAVMKALWAAKQRFGFRLVHFTVQVDHLHLIAEADDNRCLARGLQSLAIRVAKALNRLWRRAGRVFAERYHVRLLRSPREVRRALAYVPCNANKHGGPQAGIDPASSGRWFDGWREGRVKAPLDLPSPVTAARSWLLRLGWRRAGLIGVWEWPGTKRWPRRAPNDAAGVRLC